MWCRSLAIVLVVIRSKLVPDFAVSLHLIHVVVVFLYTGLLPANMAWWLAMAASTALAVGLGTWGCRYRELRPISFGGAAPATGESAAGADSGGGPDDDEEQGLSRGRGRGRGRDGAGEYELAKMVGGDPDRRID